MHRLEPEAATVELLVERVAVQAGLAIPQVQVAAPARQAQHRVAAAVEATQQDLSTTVAVVVLVQRVGSCSRILHLLAATGDGEYS